MPKARNAAVAVPATVTSARRTPRGVREEESVVNKSYPRVVEGVDRRSDRAGRRVRPGVARGPRLRKATRSLVLRCGCPVAAESGRVASGRSPDHRHQSRGAVGITARQIIAVFIRSFYGRRKPRKCFWFLRYQP